MTTHLTNMCCTNSSVLTLQALHLVTRPCECEEVRTRERLQARERDLEVKKLGNETHVVDFGDKPLDCDQLVMLHQNVCE